MSEPDPPKIPVEDWKLRDCAVWTDANGSPAMVFDGSNGEWRPVGYLNRYSDAIETEPNKGFNHAESITLSKPFDPANFDPASGSPIMAMVRRVEGKAWSVEVTIIEESGDHSATFSVAEGEEPEC